MEDYTQYYISIIGGISYWLSVSQNVTEVTSVLNFCKPKEILGVMLFSGFK